MRGMTAKLAARYESLYQRALREGRREDGEWEQSALTPGPTPEWERGAAIREANHQKR